MSSWDSESENSTGGETPLDSTWDGESTQMRPPEPRPAAAAAAAAAAAPEALRPESNQVLGVIIVYSEVHEASGTSLDPRMGQVYPMRDGDILFLGRSPAPSELMRKDGSSVPPTYSHLFPTGGLYGYISRRHLTIEMDSLGGTILTDYSRYGLYIEKAGKTYRRQDASVPYESHRVTGDETVVLMDELGAPGDADFADRRSHYRFQILRSPRLGAQDRLTETQL